MIFTGAAAERRCGEQVPAEGARRAQEACLPLEQDLDPSLHLHLAVLRDQLLDRRTILLELLAQRRAAQLHVELVRERPGG